MKPQKRVVQPRPAVTRPRPALATAPAPAPGPGIRILQEKQTGASSSSNALVAFTESPVEVNGLQLFMFRGDEGIGGSFQPLSLPAAQPRPPQYPPQRQPRPSPVRWSQAEVGENIIILKIFDENIYYVKVRPRPAVLAVTSARPVSGGGGGGEVTPPFPTVHTTPSPHTQDQAVVIIAQSNVAQN